MIPRLCRFFQEVTPYRFLSLYPAALALERDLDRTARARTLSQGRFIRLAWRTAGGQRACAVVSLEQLGSCDPRAPMLRLRSVVFRSSRGRPLVRR